MSLTRTELAYAAVVFVACAGACSSTNDSPATSAPPGVEAGTNTDASDLPDTADDATTDFVPAPHPSLPTVHDSGGLRLKAPMIVPITFDGDSLQGEIDDFVAAIPSTTYWGDLLAEYGIAKPTVHAPIHIADKPPALITDNEIRAWLADKLDGTHSEYPTNVDDAVYVLFYPGGTSIDFPMAGRSCVGFHGYHQETLVKGGDAGDLMYPYAVVARCASIPEAPVTGIQYVSAVASHEVLEAITNPYPNLNPAFNLPDNDHIAYSALGLAEPADLCALISPAFFTPADFPYTVQRMWSNARAKQGKNPCVPVLPADQAYFNAGAVLPDKVKFTFSLAGSVETQGIAIKVGEKKTVDVQLWSDGPIDSWKVTALPSGRPPELALTLDANEGKNGDVLHLTIERLRAPADFGGSTFVLKSQRGDTRNMWVGFVTE